MPSSCGHSLFCSALYAFQNIQLLPARAVPPGLGGTQGRRDIGSKPPPSTMHRPAHKACSALCTGRGLCAARLLTGVPCPAAAARQQVGQHRQDPARAHRQCGQEPLEQHAQAQAPVWNAAQPLPGQGGHPGLAGGAQGGEAKHLSSLLGRGRTACHVMLKALKAKQAHRSPSARLPARVSSEE